MKNNRSNEARLLIGLIEEAYRLRAWHGPNLKGSFRGISAREAAWRPSKDRHNIWEFVLHTAYWKYAVRRRLTGEKMRSFPLQGSNFFRRPVSLTERAWRDDIRILEDQHRLLIGAVRAHLPGRLAKGVSAAERKRTIRFLYGIAFHDVYHAGQIRLLRRMAGKKR